MKKGILTLLIAGLMSSCSYNSKIQSLEHNEIFNKIIKENTSLDTLRILSFSKEQNMKELDTNIRKDLENILEKEKNLDLVVFPEFTFIDKEERKVFFSKKKEEYFIDNRSNDVLENEIRKYMKIANNSNVNILLGGFYEEKENSKHVSFIQINRKGKIEYLARKGEYKREAFKIDDKYSYLPVICWESTNSKFSYKLIKESQERIKNSEYDFLVYTANNNINYSKLDSIKNSRNDFEKYFSTGIINKEGFVVVSDGERGFSGAIPYKKRNIERKEKKNYSISNLKMYNSKRSN